MESDCELKSVVWRTGVDECVGVGMGWDHGWEDRGTEHVISSQKNRDLLSIKAELATEARRRGKGRRLFWELE